MVTGLLIGAVGGAFRLLFIKADNLRDELVHWAYKWPYPGWLVPVAVGLVGAALARWLVVRFAPTAEGSGVQRVEAVFDGEVKPPPHGIVLVKFFGGLLATGSGLALGREGPTVQMGASLASIISHFLVKQDKDAKVVIAAGAGAGLAVAFNAPIGGSVFVFEELTATFTPWLLMGTLAAATFAVWTMRLFLGNHLDFVVRQVSLTAAWKDWPFLVLGAMLGAIGALYNSTIISLLRACDRLIRISTIQRAAVIGATIGLTAWFCAHDGGRGRQSDPGSTLGSLRNHGTGGNICVALFHRPVVLRRWRARRLVRSHAAAGSLLRRTLWPDAESLPALVGHHFGCLRCSGHGDAIYGVRARAAYRHHPDRRDDGSRRSHCRPPGRFARRHGDDHPVG